MITALGDVGVLVYQQDLNSLYWGWGSWYLPKCRYF